MDLVEPQAVCLQARFLPEGVAQGTHEPQGNGQVASSPQWTEVPSPRMNASHQVEETSELSRIKPPHTGSLLVESLHWRLTCAICFIRLKMLLNILIIF